MIDARDLRPPEELLAERGDPAARAVLEDWYLTHGLRATRFSVAVGLSLHAADADAADDAAADAAVINSLSRMLVTEPDMTPGLKLIVLPGAYGYYGVTRIGWIRRVGGDEYELINARTVRRTDGSRSLGELAADGPGRDHKLYPADKVPEEINRHIVRRAFIADANAWKSECPKPKGWD